MHQRTSTRRLTFYGLLWLIYTALYIYIYKIYIDVMRVSTTMPTHKYYIRICFVKILAFPASLLKNMLKIRRIPCQIVYFRSILLYFDFRHLYLQWNEDAFYS